MRLAARQVAVIVVLVNDPDGRCGIDHGPALLPGVIDHPVIPAGAADGEIGHICEDMRAGK